MIDDLAYLAGLIDGCGHIAFSSKGTGKKRFVIEIAVTEEGLADYLLGNFGGHKQFFIATRPRDQDKWRWRVQDGHAKALYLRIKPILKLRNQIEFEEEKSDA